MAIREIEIRSYFSNEENLAAFDVLVEVNRAEVEGHFASKVDANLAVYADLQDSGVMVFLGAFDGDALVGYAGAFFAPNLHYGYLMAVNDAIFVLPEYRKKGYGIRLIREMERVAKDRGAKFMVWQAKMDSPLNKVLPRLGCRAEEINYVKEL